MLICLYIFSGVYSLSEQNEAYSVSFFSLLLDAFDYPRVDRLRGDTCPYVCPQTGLN